MILQCSNVICRQKTQPVLRTGRGGQEQVSKRNLSTQHVQPFITQGLCEGRHAHVTWP